MFDGGEGLVDASTRLTERMEEIEQERAAAKSTGPRLDPDHVRAVESLRLAKADLERQLSATAHERRRQQLGQALAEVDHRLKALNGVPIT
ncbi:MAG: hypothetical protein AB1806_11195 [Acidobacteriota bacterium]